MSVELVLSSLAGSVVAPAGCGKTQLITDVISRPPEKPYLVLTHTTAGVTALKNRLRSVSPHYYRVFTIAGWALSTSSMFPLITGYSMPRNTAPDYNRLQDAIAHCLERGCLREIIRANYSRIFVDEYQDCTISQHRIVIALSRILPTVVFGDPMQAIFDFAGPLPHWTNEVLAQFPQIVELSTPWRWNNAGSPIMGQWVLDARIRLFSGQQIDLTGCPGHVSWVPLTGDIGANSQNQINVQYQVRRSLLPGEKFLVIGDSIDVASRHRFAQMTNGLGVVEPVDLKDVVGACSQFDGLTGTELLIAVIEMASCLMTAVNGRNLERRVETILANRNRTPPTEIESAGVNLVAMSSRTSILDLIQRLANNPQSRVYRWDAYNALIDALRLAINSPDKTMHDSAAVIREQRRHRGDKRLPVCAIGSTLLLKGLEAEHVVILNADRMNRQHLYVALSRASKSITVFSTNQFI